MKWILLLIPHGLAIFMSVVFLDSLRYKFFNHEKTQVIFGTLNAWVATLGFPGTFGTSGILSQYVIGSVELLASALLLLGITPTLNALQGFGAIVAFALMTGAVSFHLFTPLGIDPNHDGGGLFVAAVLVWIASTVVMVIRHRDILAVFGTR
ncbi:hypothetical protein L0Y34_01700 [Candidatus Parcubacteria bacterium]|nr:hypothetical protein [Candidatus Parcubacteria bacterium]